MKLRHQIIDAGTLPYSPYSQDALRCLAAISGLVRHRNATQRIWREQTLRTTLFWRWKYSWTFYGDRSRSPQNRPTRRV